MGNKSEYICKYGLYHDKPCKGQKPSSNNGWIYTAYAEALGLDIFEAKIRRTFDLCLQKVYTNRFHFNRLPNKQEPPVSRDEILGLVNLGFMNDGFLSNYDWYYYEDRPMGKYSLFQKIKAFMYLGLPESIKVRKVKFGYTLDVKYRHRNTIWQEKVYPAYDLAFTLGASDRYYVKKIHNKETTVKEFLAFHLGIPLTLLKTNKKTGSVSAKNILWLQLFEMKSKFLIKLINRKKNFQRYFGPEHIFNKEIK